MYLMNKPKGCQCQRNVEGSVFELVPAIYAEGSHAEELKCVGRLDKDTTGMLLFAGWAVLLRSAVAAGTLGAVARTSGWWCTAMALTAARRLGFSTSGLIFAGSWTSLLQTSLFTKVFALPMLPFLISREVPKAAPKAAAKPAGKAAPTKQGNIVPTRPAPPGYRYDSFGTLIVGDA